MQGYQYSKDTAEFEKALHEKSRGRLTALLAAVGVFLLIALCLLFIGSRGTSFCTADAKDVGALTCEDARKLYRCGDWPVRLTVVLQTSDEGFVRFATSCRWTTSKVEIRCLAVFLALIPLYYGLSGLKVQHSASLSAFLQISPIAISLLSALVAIDAYSFPELIQHEDTLLNVLTGSRFEGTVEALTFTFSTFYVCSTTTAFLAAAALMAVGRLAVAEFVKREESLLREA